ncbi:hypothetical protein DMUE_4788, partial [Dictyocoela muelleri]
VQRWKLLIEEYDYVLRHIYGNKNSEADTLSRYAHLIVAQDEKRDLLVELKSTLKNNSDLLKNKDNKIHITNRNPKETYEFLKLLHTELVHPGTKVLEQTLKKYFKINKLRKIISKICNECTECNKEKQFAAIKHVTFYSIGFSDNNDVVGLDIKGPIQLSNFKHNRKANEFYIFVIMDLFSRYVETDFIFDISSDTICRSFEKTWL